MTQSLILSANQTNIAAAADHLLNGRLCAFPTDTVYGVGAHAFDEHAIGRLYTAKNRPLSKGIPILLSDGTMAAQLAAVIPPQAQTLIDRFWPGPLTLVLPKRPDLPPNISPNNGIGLRVPDHAVARDLIAAAGGALAATSANQSGQPSATSARAAFDALHQSVAAVLDDGPSPHGLASTVVGFLTDTPRILRPGPLSAADLGLPVDNG